MGTILCAECACGFCQGDIAAGGGMWDYGTILNAPALCRACGELLALNYLEGEHHCPKCGGKVTFYNDPLLQDRTGFDSENGCNTFEWNVCNTFEWNSRKSEECFVLPDVAYLCPRCNEKNMRFTQMGCWD